MTTTLTTEADRELALAVARAMNRVRDPEAGRMAREEMDRMRQETRQRVGTVEVAVELVRDCRDQ